MNVACVSTARQFGWRGAAALGLALACAASLGAEPQAQTTPSRHPASATVQKATGAVDAGLAPTTAAPRAGGVALDDPIVNCTQPPANCQLADQLGHGEGGTIGATSDGDAGFAVADNFTTTELGRILSVCWWGFYRDFDAGEDCAAEPPLPPDHFTIRFLTNTPSCPNGQPNIAFETLIQDNGDFTSFTRVPTGNTNNGHVEYEYTATFVTAPFAPDTCNWIEIQNNTLETPAVCYWLWSTAPSATDDPAGNGDNWSWQTGAPDPQNDFDLAFCIDQALGDTILCSAAAVPNEACIGAAGDCWQANDSVGCEEVCCCTLVCGVNALCCLTPWTEACAQIALDLGCAVLPPNPLCAEGGPGDPGQDPANCQPFTDVNAYSSTTDPGPGEDMFIAADDFTTLANETITDICWQGTYAVAPVTDDFRVQVLGDAGGFPDVGNVIADYAQGDFLTFVREDTNVPGSGAWVIYQYRTTVTGFAVTGGECYWLVISNGIAESETWYWETADDGNGRCMIDGFGDGITPPDGWDAFDVVTGVDLAFCLGVPLDPPACGFAVLFDTGNHEVVLYDPGTGMAPTNLGWSSGDLAVAGDHQRRCVQAFTLPPLPAGEVDAWAVEQITLEGFEADTSAAEFLNYEIFARTSLDQDIQEADSVDALLEVGPMVFADIVDADYPNEFTLLVTGLYMDPGDYWLTFWATNSSALPGEPQPIESNIAWFTNGPDGINNFCTVNTPTPAAGFDGCAPSDPDGQAPGTPSMLRARVWPPGAPPSDGFGGYWLPDTVMTVAPGDDPTPDPADLYNAAFRIRGTAVVAPVPCFCDCNSEPDGVVNTQDFLALLAQWGSDGSCDCKQPPDGVVDTQDFLAILATWGDCP